MFWSTLLSIEYKILTIHIVPYIAIYPISLTFQFVKILLTFSLVRQSLLLVSKSPRLLKTLSFSSLLAYFSLIDYYPNIRKSCGQVRIFVCLLQSIDYPNLPNTIRTFIIHTITDITMILSDSHLSLRF